MPYAREAFRDTRPDDDASVAGHLVEQPSPRDGRYGVAVRDMFSDGGWTPAEPVRARDWRDNGTGSGVQSSETTFD